MSYERIEWLGNRSFFLFISIIVISIVFLPLFDARIGYSIYVVVNNSTMSSEWSRTQSTDVLSFQANTTCNGVGTSSKYQQVSDLAGLSMKRTTYTDKGNLTADDSLIVASVVNWIYITETGNDTRTSSEYTAQINESIPTIIYNRDYIKYSGKGINNFDKYVNGKNELTTRYYGNHLTKESEYAGVYNNALIFADVTPAGAEEEDFLNTTMALNLRSLSDKYSEFGYSSSDALLEESYTGSFRMRKNILIQSRYYCPYNNSLDYEWLPCCSSLFEPDSLQENASKKEDQIFQTS